MMPDPPPRPSYVLRLIDEGGDGINRFDRMSEADTALTIL